MDKDRRLVFVESEFIQYNFILSDSRIKGMVASFLLDCVSVEAFYKRLLIIKKEQNGGKLTENEKKKLRVVADEVEKVLTFFDIKFDQDLINRIFGSNDNNYMDCSIKKLRDRLVHRVNDNVIRVILERYKDIEADLKAFMNLFISNDAYNM